MYCLALHVTAGAVEESHTCAHTLSQLRQLAGDSTFPLRWRETSMNDAKPLDVSVSEKHGALFLEFVKTREGVWAHGPATICRSGPNLEAP